MSLLVRNMDNGAFLPAQLEQISLTLSVFPISLWPPSLYFSILPLRGQIVCLAVVIHIQPIAILALAVNLQRLIVQAFGDHQIFSFSLNWERPVYLCTGKSSRAAHKSSYRPPPADRCRFCRCYRENRTS